MCRKDACADGPRNASRDADAMPAWRVNILGCRATGGNCRHRRPGIHGGHDARSFTTPIADVRGAAQSNRVYLSPRHFDRLFAAGATDELYSLADLNAALLICCQWCLSRRANW